MQFQIKFYDLEWRVLGIDPPFYVELVEIRASRYIPENAGMCPSKKYRFFSEAITRCRFWRKAYPSGIPPKEDFSEKEYFVP